MVWLLRIKLRPRGRNHAEKSGNPGRGNANVHGLQERNMMIDAMSMTVSSPFFRSAQNQLVG
jgi:hypothetical protein